MAQVIEAQFVIKGEEWSPTIEKIYKIASSDPILPEELMMTICALSFCPICKRRCECPFGMMGVSLLSGELPQQAKDLAAFIFEVYLIQLVVKNVLTERELSEGITKLICPHCTKNPTCSSKEKWINKMKGDGDNGGRSQPSNVN